jgi:ABC-type cobalamin transport system ATPase subunit
LGFGGDVVNALDFLGIAGATLVPISIGIAVLRYRLYDIDRIISRTLTYGVLTVVLVGVYAAGFALLQAGLAQLTSGGGSVAVAASTLVAFALFQPLRSRIRAAMDRRFNRSRYDAQVTVNGFSRQLRDEVDLDRLRDDLRAVVGRSLSPTSIGVWLRPSERTANG